MTNFKNESVSSVTDLFTKLDTWFATVGWTSERLDVTTTADSGGEWAMRRTSGATNIRFAMSWDGANTPDHAAIYQYVDQTYVVGDRPWGQDNDSGNGFAGTLDADIDGHRNVKIGTAPIQYWAFEGTGPNGSDYTYVVVEVSAGEYVHFGFGMLDKLGGDWVGGEFAYGQRNSAAVGGSQANRDSSSWLLDGLINDSSDTSGLDMELWAATVHAQGLPSQVINGQWVVCMGGKASSPQVDFGLDRQSNDGSSSDTARGLFTWGLRAGPMANGFYRAGGGHSLSGEHGFWPIGCTYVAPNGDLHGTPIGYMPDVFGCNIKNFVGGDIVVDDDGSLYYVFPARKKVIPPAAETGTSGWMGIAYAIPAYVDPGLPSSVAANATGWFSSRNSNDYTLDGGGEITQLDDKTGNGADCTQLASNGPTLTLIDGRNWMTFGSTAGASGDRLGCSFSASATMDPGSGDFSCVVVYRNSESASDVSPFHKAGGSGGGADVDSHYGFRFNRVSADDIEWRMRDGDFGNQLSLTDNLTTYSDGSSQIVGLTYDDSIADALMFGDDNDPTTEVASDLTYASGDIIPGGTFNIGAWETTNPFDGEIAELIFFDIVLSGSQRDDVWDYLKAKWGIA